MPKMTGDHLKIKNVLFKAYQEERSNVFVSGFLLESLRVSLKLLSARWKTLFHSSINSFNASLIVFISESSLIMVNLTKAILRGSSDYTLFIIKVL